MIPLKRTHIELTTLIRSPAVEATEGFNTAQMREFFKAYGRHIACDHSLPQVRLKLLEGYPSASLLVSVAETGVVLETRTVRVDRPTEMASTCISLLALAGNTV